MIKKYFVVRLNKLIKKQKISFEIKTVNKDARQIYKIRQNNLANKMVENISSYVPIPLHLTEPSDLGYHFSLLLCCPIFPPKIVDTYVSTISVEWRLCTVCMVRTVRTRVFLCVC